MYHDVGAAAGCLVGRQRIGKFRVHNSEFTVAVVGRKATLEHAVLVGDNAAVAHFAACCRDSQHSAERSAGGNLFFLSIIIPNISGVSQAVANALGAVDNTAAADCENKINVLLTAKLYALLNHGKLRIRHNASQQYVFQPCVLQAGADAVQQTAFLGAVTAEVYEYLVGTVVFTPFTCFIFGIFTEDYLCRCVNLKMIHNISSLPVIIYHFLKGNKRITKRLPEVAGSLSQNKIRRGLTYSYQESLLLCLL